MIAVQHIVIRWTKWERGGAADGAKRNALPRDLPFAPPGDVAADWVHRARFVADQKGEYAFADSWLSGVIAKDKDGLLIRPQGYFAEVIAASHHFGGNRLGRPNFGGVIARLPFGQRLTVRINGSSDGDHQRLYSEDTFHIGFAETATLDLPLFRDIDERELLY